MKRFLCCILVFVVLVSATACGESNDITGIWEQEMEISILGREEASSVISVLRFTFREDGTGKQEQIITDGIHPDAVRGFSYSQKGDTLILNYGEKNTEEFGIVLDRTSLRLENNRGSFYLKRTEQ